MPPKRAAPKAEPAPATSTRPSRKRAAAEENESAAKRPRRASTTAEKPAPKATARAKATASAPATKKKAAATTTNAKKPTAAAASKAKATTASKRAAAAKSNSKPKPKPKAKAVSEESEEPEEEPKPKVPRVPKPKPPTLNSLPTKPAQPLSPIHLFVFGNGGSGEFGLGPDQTEEIQRPRLHAWFEQGTEEGKFGEKGVGLESISAGGMHSVAITPDGKLWSWGVNDEGALGREVTGVVDPETQNPIDREELEAWPTVVDAITKDNYRPTYAACGDSVTFTLNETGHIKGWGVFRSSSGPLSFNANPKATQIQRAPSDVPGLEKVQFSSVHAGPNHAIGLSVDGKVYAWGSGENGQLGRKLMGRHPLNSTRPDSLNLRKVVVIGTGYYHSFAVDSDGDVFAWGLNQYGQLGLDPTDTQDRTVWQPTLVPSLSPSELGNDARVVQISGGEHHTLFLLSDGRVFACGRFDSSQLGFSPDHPATIKAQDADIDYVYTPARVYFPPVPTADKPQPELPKYKQADELKVPNPIVKVVASGRYNLAVSKSGHAYSWGYGAESQLGLGKAEEQMTPARILWKATADEYFVSDASTGGVTCYLITYKKSERVAAEAAAAQAENSKDKQNETKVVEEVPEPASETATT